VSGLTRKCRKPCQNNVDFYSIRVREEGGIGGIAFLAAICYSGTNEIMRPAV